MSEVAPEGAPPEAAAAEPSSEPAWAPDPSEWEQTQEQLAQLQQLVQPQPPPWQQAAPQGPQMPTDVFAEDYPQQMQAYIEHVNAPLREWQQQQQLQAAEAEGRALLDQLAGQGEFDRDMAWARANQIIVEHGGDPRKALDQAARDVRDYERRVGERYHQQQIEQLQATSGAPRGVPSGVGGSQTVPVGGYGNVPNAVTNRIFGGR